MPPFQSKLTDEQRQSIFKLIAENVSTCAQIAEKFSVSERTVQRMKTASYKAAQSGNGPTGLYVHGTPLAPPTPDPLVLDAALEAEEILAEHMHISPDATLTPETKRIMADFKRTYTPPRADTRSLRESLGLPKDPPPGSAEIHHAPGSVAWAQAHLAELDRKQSQPSTVRKITLERHAVPALLKPQNYGEV